VVAGAQDGLVPQIYAETYASEIPGARLVVIEGAAHWLPFEKPDELTALVTEFLSAQPVG
jgi:pimeloyl-ACP methyl ester carboxylesterase